MRCAIAGGGIAGTLLAWRLAQDPAVERVELLLGEPGATDATELSGGVVRAYEPDPEGRRLALASLLELRSSDVLRAWSGYRETGAVYLGPSDRLVSGDLREIQAQLPGSARLATGPELARLGWAGLPAGTVGVLERRAGYVNARGLRASVVGDLSTRANVRLVQAAATAVAQGDRTVTASSTDGRRTYDFLVVAAGAWTPGLLKASGLPSLGLRTKAIRCATYAARGDLPPPFADATSGLYGRPTADGRLMLGLATDDWDVQPGRRPPAAPSSQATAAAQIARGRMPWLELGPPQARIEATDCYGEPPTLGLRRVAGDDGRIWTFTGGSGGSLKTALAASREAAERLLGAVAHQPSKYGE